MGFISGSVAGFKKVEWSGRRERLDLVRKKALATRTPIFMT